MATRCAIGYMEGDDTFNAKVISKYSHWDGYPEYTGAILTRHYTDFDLKIKPMIELGDQSFIAPEIYPSTETHSFDEPEDNVTVFYGRDRGETDVEPKTFNNLSEFIDRYRDLVDYLYVYNPFIEEWFCYDVLKGIGFNLCAMEEEAA